MVIYEVNLTVNDAIYPDYYMWLLDHVKEILAIEGFQKAEVGHIEHHKEDGKKRIRVNYFLDTYASLQNYFTHTAAALRAGAIEKFGDQFSATRRVILDQVVVEG